jgi:Predicted peptidase
MGALLLFAFTGTTALSQVQTARYINIGSNVHAFYEYLPQGYSSGSGSYPLIVFLHGLGELGAGNSSTLPAVANNGLPRLIRDGKFPASFTVNGTTHRFIVISPQFVAWPSAKDISDVIEYAVKTYRVNQQRIYVTGLSMGGGGTWGIASEAAYNKRLAAIVPVCGALYPATARTNVVADSKIPAWATHNNGDPTVSVDWTNDWIRLIKARDPNADVKKSIFNSSSHDAWTHTYDPNFRENGVNIYEWMLQHQLGSQPPPLQTPNQPPVANAGGNKTITLPTNSVQLNGSGSDVDGRIVSYQWTKISGPANGVISSPTVANPILSQLVAGTYVYQLTVTDDKGAKASNQATINVLAASTTNKPPVANAGPDQALTAPIITTTIKGSGSDPDGSIVSYRWAKISGPAGGYVSTPTSATSAVNVLNIGTYVYELKVTDNKGATATDRVNIVVSSGTPSGGSNSNAHAGTSPLKYVNVNIYGGAGAYNNTQWNNWNVVTAPGNQASINVSSGNFRYSDGSTSTIRAVLSHSQQIRDNGPNYVNGQMAPKEVLRYLSYSSINRTLRITGLSTAKKYTIDLYSSRNAQGYNTTFKVNGVSKVINTYNNASSKASFTGLTPNAKGEIEVEIIKGNTWNYLNGFTVIESGTSTASARVAASSTTSEVELADEGIKTNGTMVFETWPNPVMDQLQVKLSNRHTGQLVIKVFDRTGALRHEVRTTKNQELMQVVVPFDKLSTGTYFVRCTVGDWSETKQVVKIR